MSNIKDKRKNSDDYSGEVCRVCGCRDVHTKLYNKPTMDCISYLREEINRYITVNKKNIEAAREYVKMIGERDVKIRILSDTIEGAIT